MTEEEVRKCRIQFLVYDVNKKVLDKFLEFRLKGRTLQSFLSSHKHKLFHDWRPREDCKSCNSCGYKKLSKQQIVTNAQWNNLFTRTFTCTNHPLGDHECMFQAKFIRCSDLDVTLSVYILDNFFNNSQQIKKALLELRQARNLISHSQTVGQKTIFEAEWQKCETNILLISGEISQQYEADIRREINDLESRDLDQMSSIKHTEILKEVMSDGISTNKSQLDEIKITVDRMETTLETNLEEATEIKTHIDETCETFKETTQLLNNHREVVSSALTANKSQIDDVKKTVCGMETKLETHLEGTEVLKQQVDETHETCEETKQFLNDHHEEVSSTLSANNSKLDDIKTTVDGIETKLETYIEGADVMEKQVHETHETCEETKQLLNEHHEVVSSALSANKSQIDDIQTTVCGMETKLETHLGGTDVMKQQVDETHETCEETKQLLNEHHQVVTSAVYANKSQLEDIQTTVDGMDTKLGTHLEKADVMKKQVDETHETCEETKQLLNEHHEVVSSAFFANKSQIDDVQKTVCGMESKLETHLEGTEVLKQQVDETCEETKQLLNDHHEEVSSVLSANKSELDDIKITVDGIDTKLETHIEGADVMKKQVDENQQTCEETKQLLNEHHEVVSSALSANKSQIDDIQTTVCGMETKLGTHLEGTEVLKQQVDDTHETCKETKQLLNDNHEVVTGAVSANKSQLEDIQTTVDGIDTKLGTHLEETDVMKKQVDETHETCEETKQLLNEHHEEVSSVLSANKFELDDIKITVDVIDTKLETHIEGADVMKKQVDETHETCEETKQLLNEHHEVVTSAVSANKSQLEDIQTTVDGIDTKVGTHLEGADVMKKQVDETHETCEETKQLLNEHHERILKVSKTGEAVQQDVHELHDTRADDSKRLQKTSEETIQGIEKLDKTYKISSSEITIAVMHGMQRVYDETAKSNRIMEETNNRLEEERKVLQRRMAELEESNNRLSMTIIELQHQSNDYHNKTGSKIKNLIKQFEEEKVLISDFISSNEDKSSQMEWQITDLEESVDDIPRQVEELINQTKSDIHYCPYERCRMVFRREDSLIQHYQAKHANDHIVRTSVVPTDVHYYKAV